MSRPGAMDQRIIIRRVDNRTPDGYGGFTETVTTLATAWAAIIPKGGSEQDRADRVNAVGTVVFAIRNRQDIDFLENDRIEWLGRDYNIRVIEYPSDRAQYVEILAQRGVAE